MVGVAQLVEHLVVVQDVAGSSPVVHPKFAASRRSRSPDPRFRSPGWFDIPASHTGTDASAATSALRSLA